MTRLARGSFPVGTRPGPRFEVWIKAIKQRKSVPDGSESIFLLSGCLIVPFYWTILRARFGHPVKVPGALIFVYV